MPNGSARPRRRGPGTLPLLIILPLLAVGVLTPPFPSNAAPSPPSHSVRYEVTGAPGERFSISYVGDGSGTMATSTDTPVPWHADTRLHRMTAPFVELRLAVVRGAMPMPPTAATTDCRIISDGRVVAVNHTSARSAYVDCDAIVP